MSRSTHLRSVQPAAAPSSSVARRGAAARSRAERPSEPFVGEVVAIGDDGRVSVRSREPGAVAIEARGAHVAGWRPALGDSVAVLPMASEALVVAVVESSSPLALVAPDGASVRLVDGHLEVIDAGGHLIARSVEGGVEIGPARGDLRLRAPHGRVAIEAGLDLTMRAQRDVVVSADRSVETRVGDGEAELTSRVRVEHRGATISGPTVAVRARKASLVAAVSEVVARELKTSATRIETTATHVETTSDRVVLRARDVVQEVSELLETKVGRVRTLVRGVFSLRSRSTSMKSKDDTAIDGRRVLLG